MNYASVGTSVRKYGTDSGHAKTYEPAKLRDLNNPSDTIWGLDSLRNAVSAALSSPCPTGRYIFGCQLFAE